MKYPRKVARWRIDTDFQEAVEAVPHPRSSRLRELQQLRESCKYHREYLREQCRRERDSAKKLTLRRRLNYWLERQMKIEEAINEIQTGN